MVPLFASNRRENQAIGTNNGFSVRESLNRPFFAHITDHISACLKAPRLAERKSPLLEVVPP